jgi:hypothetical protein
VAASSISARLTDETIGLQNRPIRSATEFLNPTGSMFKSVRGLCKAPAKRGFRILVLASTPGGEFADAGPGLSSSHRCASSAAATVTPLRRSPYPPQGVGARSDLRASLRSARFVACRRDCSGVRLECRSLKVKRMVLPAGKQRSPSRAESRRAAVGSDRRRLPGVSVAGAAFERSGGRGRGGDGALPPPGAGVKAPSLGSHS